MKLLRLGLLGLILVCLNIGLAAPAQAVDYSNSNMMDDQIFDNAGTMSQTQIQAFLAAKGPCLANYNDVDPIWNGSSWSYSGSVPASYIIFKASQQWGINPQVIIATLQKEESLITGTDCSSWRYNSAMGYGCPDGGGCNPKYVGFTRQVLWGSWQLKFNKERAYGNTGWDEDDAITYVGYMTEGDRRRCGTCTLTHYDGNANIDGQLIHIENGTTASLFTYTPHLNQSFPGIFESWFGSVRVPSYGSLYAGQGAYPTVRPGSPQTTFLKYKNVGNQPWYDDTGLSGAPAGTKPVHLATSNPVNRFSLVGSAWGGGQNRPTGVFAAVYEADGTTLAPNQHVVQPGQIAKFTITFYAPTNVAPGTYREYFRPILEGSDIMMNDPQTFLDVTIQPKTYGNQFFGQSSYPVIVRGQSADSFMSYKNTGNQRWYDDVTANANSAKPVHLATSSPLNRYSLVGTWWGPNQNRPALQFAAVYETDGTTLAANQHVVQPGQIAKFSIKFFGPTNLSPRTLREFFRPIFEGGELMNDPGTFLDVTLQ